MRADADAAGDDKDGFDDGTVDRSECVSGVSSESSLGDRCPLWRCASLVCSCITNLSGFALAACLSTADGDGVIFGAGTSCSRKQ